MTTVLVDDQQLQRYGFRVLLDSMPETEVVASLTEREREILVAIGKGWTNSEVAARFVVAESTVKTHVGRVLAKIGARDRVQAVIFAYDQGIARPGAG